MSPEEWLAAPAELRESVSAAVTHLAGVGEGAGLAAVTKVLAALRPQLVPLMDDAALWFALESPSRPESAETPSAPSTLFLPMLDWFADAVRLSERALVAVAVRHPDAVLDAAQVLDRLLWVESWGYRLARSGEARWWSVEDGEAAGVVEVRGAAGVAHSGDVVDLTRCDLDPGWVVRARAALNLVRPR